jgi:hypothetical protein
LFLEKKKKFGGCCFSLGIVVVLGFEKKKERERPRSIDQLGKEKKKKKRKKKRKERENERGGRKTSGSRESIYTSIVFFFFLGAIDKITRFEK